MSNSIEKPFEEWNKETTKPVYDALTKKYNIEPVEIWTFVINEMPLSQHSIQFQSALKKEFPEIWKYANDCESIGIGR